MSDTKLNDADAAVVDQVMYELVDVYWSAGIGNSRADAAEIARTDISPLVNTLVKAREQIQGQRNHIESLESRWQDYQFQVNRALAAEQRAESAECALDELIAGESI